jgi:predicted nucleic acid-binding protein
MRWLLQSPKPADQRYAEDVLKRMSKHGALVPNLWHLESINVLLGAEKRSEVSTGDIERFISQLEMLPILTDPLTAHKAFSRTQALARSYKLSSYDAAYLELALREGLPIATLDKILVKASIKAGVTIFLKPEKQPDYAE